MADSRRSPELAPDIILFQILPRLPGKSVLRCMSVSKQWYSFLKKRMFMDMHLHHATNQNHNKHVVLSRTIPPYNFGTIDCEAPPEDDHGLTFSRSLPFEACSPATMSTSHISSIIASCNGLVCVGMMILSISAEEYSDLVLWNPLTNEYKKLSKYNSHQACYKIVVRATTLCHTSSSIDDHDDDYKLLRVTPDHEVYIYSLKLDSWRRVKTTIPIPPSSSRLYKSESWMPPCSSLNEKLYFLNQVIDGRFSRNSDSIIRFDTMTEKFAEIAIPSFGNPTRTYCLCLTLLCANIHLCVICDVREKPDSPKCCIELWRMNGDVGSWTRLLSYLWIPCLQTGTRLDVILKHVATFPCSLLLGAHIMRNGSVLILDGLGGRFYKVDLEKHHPNNKSSYVTRLPRIPLKGKYNKRGSYVTKLPRIPLKGKYIETFLSPNQYIK